MKHNYVALPPSEAFRIEYWALEEAKLRRQPPEKEFSRQVFVIVGGGSGIGRETALQAAQRGAHVVVADRDLEAAQASRPKSRHFAARKMYLRWRSIFATANLFGADCMRLSPRSAASIV